MSFRRIYEINTRVWLWELVARGHLARPNLAEVPARYITAWQRWQIDAIWLMGVWEPSAYSARVARHHPHLVAAFRQALDDFTPDDCIGSPYAVKRYEVAEQLGGLDGLRVLRRRLREAGIGLILDFVPNHTACDHPWVYEHPDYYVQGTADEQARRPEAYFQAQTVQGTTYIAHGRDPYFPPWTDTAQLHYGKQEVHEAMQHELLRLVQWCDGVRCDMAMLCLPEVFARTWGRPSLPLPPSFWPTAIATVHHHVPDFCFVAEVYWQLETRLHQLGFALTYDKGFYDALVARDTARLRQVLQADRATLESSLRFLENHDEARAAARFDLAQHAAAALTILTLPGAVLLHEGQCQGRTSHLPVQLRRRRAEAEHPWLTSFYDRLLACPSVQDGAFALLQPRLAWEHNWSFQHMLAWAWWDERQAWLVVINYAETRGQCTLNLADLPWPTADLQLRDLLAGTTFDRAAAEIRRHGLYVDLPPFGTHYFEVTCTCT